MSRGVDLWAADIIIHLRRYNHDLKLIGVIPYERFESIWPVDWKKHYKLVRKELDWIYVISKEYTPAVYQRRNEFMVDHSSMLIAVFNGEAGGAKNTVQYANQKGVPVKIAEVWSDEKTYKTVEFLLFVVFILTLHAAAEEGRYASRISKEDCFLCSDRGGTAYAEYWGQDNVGVVHLNTFEILPIRINQYDDAGEFVRKESGTMESLGLYHNDTYVNSMTNPDRGYSNVKISGVKYKTDRKSIQMNLCDTCIEALNRLNWNNDTPPEFAILNFKEQAIRPLEQTLTWFFSGNFGINCEYEDNGDIDMLIAYLPPRWDKTQ